ncbi:MAG TPA: CdaR family protein [Rectinemataceae bacterium]|nr:CdaR family protein [Rectinemataceae bacterium]
MKLERFFKLTFADWPAKVLSLAVALLLTLFFSLTRLEQRTINIPLTVSLNDEMAPSSQYPRMVRVVLRGERDVIYGIREDEVSASLDLAEYKNEGVFKAPIRLEKRGNALLADPLEIHPEPSEIAIGLERRMLKRVPVTPSFKGFLESGFELTTFDLAPAEVTVSGPAGLVARTTEVSTDTIELSGKKSDFTVNVRLLKKDNLLSLEGKESVIFSAKVRKSLDIKNFVNLKILPRGLIPSLEFADILPTGNVRMHIPEEAMANFDQDSLLYVDLSAIAKPGTYTVDVTVSAPEGAVVETFEPQTLTFSLQTAGSGSGGRLSGSIAPLTPSNIFNLPQQQTAPLGDGP